MEFKCCDGKFVKKECISKAYAFLRVISDKNRLQIICVLQGGSKYVCDIFPILGISEKLASHHLGKLKKIGLLNEKREGNFIRYGLNKKVIKDYKKIINQLIK
ncbi:MAG: metalloregulator ArsR/SmtB family transcription factor [Parcubacteria group bacterium]|jgi:DNA-binding transcriptional ArsR family regulator